MSKNLKRLMYIFMMVLFFSMALNTNVFATSWVEMEPEEVDDKAEVVVLGTYKFSGEIIPSDAIFSDVIFDVTSVYRGEADEQIIAGIDIYDVRWVDEFQNEGGEFLLFLEKGEQNDFLTPVGGPNGMIQIKGGEVFNQTGIKSSFYERILQGESKESSRGNNELLEKEEAPSYLLVSSIGVLIGGIGGFLIYRRLRKK